MLPYQTASTGYLSQPQYTMHPQMDAGVYLQQQQQQYHQLQLQQEQQLQQQQQLQLQQSVTSSHQWTVAAPAVMYPAPPMMIPGLTMSSPVVLPHSLPIPAALAPAGYATPPITPPTVLSCSSPMLAPSSFTRSRSVSAAPAAAAPPSQTAARGVALPAPLSQPWVTSVVDPSYTAAPPTAPTLAAMSTPRMISANTHKSPTIHGSTIPAMLAYPTHLIHPDAPIRSRKTPRSTATKSAAGSGGGSGSGGDSRNDDPLHDAKRIANTISARRARARKAAKLGFLEAKCADLERELRQRLAEAKAVIYPAPPMMIPGLTMSSPVVLPHSLPIPAALAPAGYATPPITPPTVLSCSSPMLAPSSFTRSRSVSAAPAAAAPPSQTAARGVALPAPLSQPWVTSVVDPSYIAAPPTAPTLAAMSTPRMISANTHKSPTIHGSTIPAMLAYPTHLIHPDAPIRSRKTPRSTTTKSAAGSGGGSSSGGDSGNDDPLHDAKRIANTISARRARARKAAKLGFLEARCADLERELRQWLAEAKAVVATTRASSS